MKLPGRNDPCPCGSGKKFKVCHLGREQELIGLMSKKPVTAVKSIDAKVIRGKQK
jgi:preprotein translocase subunit SecA